jgi:predicted transcriptional regulator YdeE
MKVMVIVKASKNSEAGQMPTSDLLAAMGKFNQELTDAGIMLSGEGLHPSSKGARVHFSGKNRTVTDGPFTETKELIAGFWMWRVKSMQEAIDWVKKCPNPMTEDSDIEIRQVFSAEDFGAEFTPELREQESALRAKGLGLNEPTFQNAPDMLVAGLSRHYTSETRIAIPQHWEQFVQRVGTIPCVKGGALYGVCYNSSSDCSFDYLTGFEATPTAKAPADFAELKIKASRYAVFVHTGHVSAIPKALELIWNQWAPDCGLKIARGRPCFERYTSEFNSKTGMGGTDIWIPIEA